MIKIARYKPGNALFIQYIRKNDDSIEIYVVNTETWHQLDNISITEWNNSLNPMTNVELSDGTETSFYQATVPESLSNPQYYIYLNSAGSTTSIANTEVRETGMGPIPVTVTVTDSSDNPVQNATVAYYDGDYLAGITLTDDDGIGLLSLHAGTYTVAIIKTGYVHTPESIEISIDNKEISHTIIKKTITVGETISGFSVGVIEAVYNNQGEITDDTFTVELVQGSGLPGQSLSAIPRTIASVGGVLTVPGMAWLSEYRIKRGEGSWVHVVVPVINPTEAEYFLLPESLATS